MDSKEERDLRGEISGIREWLVRLDTKLDYLNEVKTTAEDADKKADRALEVGDQNSKTIDGMKKAAMWAIGTAVVFGGTIITIIFK